MKPPAYLRPRSITEVSDCLKKFPEAQLLAGGQSLLGAWRLGLCNPSHFVDLQDVPDLNDIRQEGDWLWVGSMCTHAQIGHNPFIATHFPMLSALANGIADAQIRNVGTIGGALANNDPAACWPTGILAMDAGIVTNLRVIKADAFFQSLFSTALMEGEWILGLRFPQVLCASYLKFEQSASRFALVGVAVARLMSGQVRVAITGLGHGVTRWIEAETALTSKWQVQALNNLVFDPSNAQNDIHASALYRSHLVSVLCRRAIAADTGDSAEIPTRQNHTLSLDIALIARIQGSSLLHATPERVWHQLQDPVVLQRCIPGCESMVLIQPEHYQAVIQIGLGPFSATFKTQVVLLPELHQTFQTPSHFRLILSGQAGALGEGKATILVQLQAEEDPQSKQIKTRIDWQAEPELTGKLAQLGNRLMDASAKSMSQEFFNRFSLVLSGNVSSQEPHFYLYALTMKVKQWFQRFFER